MKLGTKSLLFGGHQFLIHPALVLIAWVKLYKSFPSWRELGCIFIHDWGYWGVDDLKGKRGDHHPEFGAKIATRLLGCEWGDFILGHSAFYIARKDVAQSKLFAPDKYWHCMISLRFFKALTVLTGEFKYYRNIKHARQVAQPHETDQEWWGKLQKVCSEKIDGKFKIDKKSLA